MKFIYLIISLNIFCATSVCGQKKLLGRNYFDSNWHLSSIYNYEFYREVYKYNNTGYYLIYDYYEDGTMQSETYADNYDFSCGNYPTDCLARDGYTYWYYTNGKPKTKHRFKNGLIVSREEWNMYGNKTSEIGCISGDCCYGYGTFIYDNRDYYVGNFSNCKRHGMGTYNWANGQSYYGESYYDQFVKNNANPITLKDVKDGLEVLNGIAKLYKTLTKD